MADEKKSQEKKAKSKRPQALKRDLQSKRRNEENRAYKAKTQTAVRALQKAIAEGNKEGAQSSLDLVFSLMDKGVKTGIFKLNKASRIKSRMTKQVKART